MFYPYYLSVRMAELIIISSISGDRLWRWHAVSEFPQ